MKILVTGAAGFIGYHVSKQLCERGYDVAGIDNLNDYYDVSLKEARLEQLASLNNFQFKKLDIAHQDELKNFYSEFRPNKVIHLAAQAGVRYSIENPMAYVSANLVGFMNILENCRHFQVEHLVYASSSSVYGANKKMPFSVHDNVDHPVSFYAATKKSNELMAHSYSHLYGLPCTGLRFFTVYGPWGRPDMALFIFTKKILAGEPIDVFNFGNHRRDFTYIDDIVDGVIRVTEKNPQPDENWSGMNPDPGTSSAPYRICNIGSNNPVSLEDFIEIIEKHLGKKAKRSLRPMALGDVRETYADIDDLKREFGFSPSTRLDKGIKNFVDWYQDFYGPKVISSKSVFRAPEITL